MFRKRNLICAVIIGVLFCLTACGQSVKYVSTDADDISGQVTEYNDSQEINQIKVEDTATASDYGYQQDTSEELVPVHVCGAVNKPGLYYMKADSLKADALEVAGGFVPEAAIDYINLAEMIVYGEKIYFPYTYELEEGYNLNSSQQDSSTNNLVNINTATKDELMSLPGIGESKAEAIIKYREKKGPFQSIEDITNIPGIKEGVYNNIKEHIVVN